MPVSLALTLPDQPAAGLVTWLPLGGDGFTAPHSAYLLGRVALANDAGGGLAVTTITLDPRYESIVSQVMFQKDSVAAATLFMLEVATANADYIDRIRSSADNAVGDAINSAAWSPAPFLKAATLTLTTPNTDTETNYLDALIYNFNKEASQVSPLNVLLACLPRAASLIT